jgi:CrcB protein
VIPANSVNGPVVICSFEAMISVSMLLSALEEKTLQKYLLIAAGGALGSIARYGIGSWVAGRMGIRFPYGTLIVNTTACAILGFTMAYLGRHTDISPAWRFLVPVGFIGAYSTFSTWEWETLVELREGAFGIAAVYAIGSFAAGIGAAWAGSALGDLFS